MTALAIDLLEPTLCIPRRSGGDGVGGLIGILGQREVPFPLESVQVRAELVGTCAVVRVRQRFRNEHDQPLEAVHIFPVSERAAVTSMVLRAGDVEVVATCRERDEAEKEFAQARQAGHRAALLTQEREDVHTLRATNIPPREAVEVELVLVEQLEVVDGLTRWRFPTVVAPRYLPGAELGHSGPGVLPDTDHVPDASRLQPPLRLEGGTTLDLEAVVRGPISAIETSLHAAKIGFEGGGVRVAPSGSATLDRDFIVAFSTAADREVATRAWTDGAHTLVLVEPPALGGGPVMPRDAVLVVDISGSMQGSKIEAAKKALTSAVHGLVAGDRFRLIAFDDRVEAMSADFLAYGEDTLRAADAWIGRLRPRGGTEMLPPIQEALAGETPDGRLRTVLFITDGQAWNTAELTAAVANRRKAARFFTMGIDTAVNSALLSGLARAGGGTCELLTPSDDIEGAVARLEARFGAPLVTDLRPVGFTSAGLAGADLFEGRPAAVLIEGVPDTVELQGQGRDGVWSVRTTPARIPTPLGALWARERVRALEDQLTLKPYEAEALRPAIVQIGVKHGIASRFTAFVAVERSRTVEGDLVEVVQPAEKPAEWAMLEGAVVAGLAGGCGAAGGMPMAPMAAAPPAPGAMAPRMTNSGAVRGRAKGSTRVESGFAKLRRVFDRRDAPAEAPADGFALGDMMEDADEAEVYSLEDAAPEAERRLRDVRAPEEKKAEAGGDAGATLAAMQGADGGFGGVEATAAALLVLVLAGHTRRRGLRRRVVQKAATFLESHRGDAAAELALAALEAAERGATAAPDDTWRSLTSVPRIGALLAEALG